MGRFAFAALGCAALLMSGAAWGQAPVEPAQAASAPSTCELHVWPAPPIKAMTQGWLFNHVVDQAFKRSDEAAVAKPDVLAPERQVALIEDAELAVALRLPPGTSVVTHAEPLPRAQAHAKQRHASSASSCYSEVILHQIVFDEAPIVGRSLKALVAYREFGDGPAPRASFTTWAETGLKLFPPRSAETVAAAEGEIVEAYKANLREFANFATAPRPTKKARR